MALISFFLTTLLTLNTVNSQVPIANPIIGAVSPPINPVNGINTLVDGVYQWISPNGLFTVNICSGLSFDRNVYLGIQRSATNFLEFDDDLISFFPIIARANGLRIGSDGVFAVFNGFLANDAFGIDDVQILFTYSRCDNVYEIEINDESYTLVKISNIVTDPTLCFRPGINTFSDLGTIAQFTSGGLPWNPGFQLTNTWVQSGLNQNNWWGCWTLPNIQTGVLNRRGTLYGVRGPLGRRLWEDRLILDVFDDDLINDGCVRGIEFLLRIPRGIWCSRRCYNRPTWGYSGLLNRVLPLPQSITPQTCPQPNFNNLVGFSRFGFGSPLLNGGGVIGAAPIVRAAGVGVVPQVGGAAIVGPQVVPAGPIIPGAAVGPVLPVAGANVVTPVGGPILPVAGAVLPVGGAGVVTPVNNVAGTGQIVGAPVVIGGGEPVVNTVTGQIVGQERPIVQGATVISTP